VFAEIITVGDELLIGQTVDTNSAWLGSALNQHGIRIKKRCAVADDAHEIRQALDAAFARVDLVLMTGGLGPTKDDITKKVLCDYYACGEREDTEVLALLERYFRDRGRAMLEINRGQALLPAACETLMNLRGTAPGMWFDRNGKVLISMPGVPYEMQYIMEHGGFPRIRERFRSTPVTHRTLTVINIAESLLSKHLETFEAALPAGFKLAYLPNLNLIRLRISTGSERRANDEAALDTAFHALQEACREWMVAAEDITPPEVTARLLLEKKLQLATAESCTGGNLAHTYTLIPGVSATYRGSVVAYANDIKKLLLGVNPADIEAYGAVSEPVAKAMALAVCQKLGTDCSIATTGIAGPDGGTAEKPVGTVFIAAALNSKVHSERFRFFGTRDQIIQRSTWTGFHLLNRLLESEA
jgi:nicotinamide-nucleotide amidase